MSYLALCTFDLKDGNQEDYRAAYEELARIGFLPQVVSNERSTIRLPTTTTVGEFKAQDAGTLRDSLTSRVQVAFRARRLYAEIFVLVAGEWTWGYRPS